MPRKKIKKRKKNSRMRGSATHGGGARKKRKKSGHRGGSGMSGSGKRADHKKTLITKKHGNTYFGKRGLTSRKTERDKRQRINLQDVKFDFESYLKNGVAKRSSKGVEINLKGYKILGKGGIEGLKDKTKEKIKINAKSASASALEKLKKAGIEVNLSDEKNKEKKDVKKAGNVEKPANTQTDKPDVKEA